MTQWLKKHWLPIVEIIIIIGLLFYIILGKQGLSKTLTCQSIYKFINPQPVCEVSEKKELEKMGFLEKEVSSFINQLEDKRQVKSVSVFFRDLTTKRWFGINENENYLPASLLKLPIMVAILKLSEINPDILKEQFLYESNDNTIFEAQNQIIKPKVLLETGKVYTVEELVRNMIVYSNNQTTELLSKTVDESFLEKVLVDLGVYVPTSYEMEKDFVSVKTYGAILRALWNASYLNRANSEKALGLLAESDFKDGLVAGVPKLITVAHKFGEKTVYENGTGKLLFREMHDCGIIYQPDRPYILCMMTKGDDYKTLENTIKDISRIVWEDIRKN